jgi:flagellar protein FliO/FliZ
LTALFATLLVPQFAYSQNPEPEVLEAESVPEAADVDRFGESRYIFTDVPETPPPASFPAILRMVLVLVLVAGVIYLVVFFLRRVSRPQAEQNPHLKILASTHLGNGRFVHVVSLGNQAWLVGAGEGGISHIADVNDKEILDVMLLDASRKSAEVMNPLSGFQSLLKRFSASGDGGEDRLLNIKKRRERFKRF